MKLQHKKRLGALASALIGRVTRRPTRLPALEAYALWADSYPPRPHNPLMHAEQKVVARMIASTCPTRALDVGTGSGRYLPLLAATGARVVGVDFCQPMLARASAAIGARVCGDARCLPFGNATFDLVSASLMVGDVADLAGWVGEMARVLAPGGHLIYSDFHPRWATAGWRRTFQTADGRSIEVAYFSRAIAEHITQLHDSRFDVRQIREQGLAAEGTANAAGADAPILVAFHAVKRPASLHAGEPPPPGARRW